MIRYNLFVALSAIVSIGVIGACTYLVYAAYGIKGQSTRHGDSWGEQLLAGGYLGISAGAMQLIFLAGFQVTTLKKMRTDEDVAKAKKIFFAVELLLVIIAVTSILIPGVSQWPSTYIETNISMYSLILFIIFNSIGILSAMRNPIFIQRYQPPGVGNHQFQGPAALYPIPNGYNGGVVYTLNPNTGQSYAMQQIQNSNGIGFYQPGNPITGQMIHVNNLPNAS